MNRILTRLDPASAARIHSNDTPKLIRAIEVCLAARKPLSQVLGDNVLARDPLTAFACSASDSTRRAKRSTTVSTGARRPCLRLA